MSNKALYSSFGLVDEQPVIVGFLLFCQALPPISSALKLLINHFARKYEFQADNFAKNLGYQEQLSSALVKLSCQQYRNGGRGSGLLELPPLTPAACGASGGAVLDVPMRKDDLYTFFPRVNFVRLHRSGKLNFLKKN